MLSLYKIERYMVSGIGLSSILYIRQNKFQASICFHICNLWSSLRAKRSYYCAIHKKWQYFTVIQDQCSVKIRRRMVFITSRKSNIDIKAPFVRFDR